MSCRILWSTNAWYRPPFPSDQGHRCSDTQLDTFQKQKVEPRNQWTHTWCHGNLSFILKDHFTIEGHCWDHPLLKHDNIGWIQAKVVVLLKEVLSRCQSELTGHYVPEEVEQKHSSDYLILVVQASLGSRTYTYRDLRRLTREPCILSHVFCLTTPGFCEYVLPGFGTGFFH